MPTYKSHVKGRSAASGGNRGLFGQGGERGDQKRTRGRSPKTRLVDIHEIAEFYGVSPETVYDWKRAGRIPFVKVGKFLRFELRAVRAAIEKSMPVAAEGLGQSETRAD